MELDVEGQVALELATKKEVLAAIAAMAPSYCRKIVKGNSQPIASDGTCRFRVYDVPDGMRFRLGKFIVWGDSHNPSTGSVYTDAAAWAGLFHGGIGAANLADFWPYPEASTGQVLPFSKEYNSLCAPEWLPPDNIYFYGTGLTAGENITVLIFGELEALRKRS